MKIAQLRKQRRRTLELALLAGAVVAGLMFHASVHQHRPRRILVGRDVSDIAPLMANQVESFYDPYFVPLNHFAVLVVSATNPSPSVAR